MGDRELKEGDELHEAIIRLRGFINDMIHPLLSAGIFIDDLLLENRDNIDNSQLLLIDSQITSAINALFELRSIVLYYYKLTIYTTRQASLVLRVEDKVPGTSNSPGNGGCKRDGKRERPGQSR